MPRIEEQELDIFRSIDFDKERFLDDLVASVHTTREEFERLYILEEYPIDILQIDFTDCNSPTEYIFVTKQEFHIRRKTAEEIVGDQSHLITQGEK
jgi:hypothetical protein